MDSTFLAVFSLEKGRDWSGLCWILFNVHSHLHRLVSAGSRNQDGSPRCSGKALPGGADTSPLAGKVPGYLEPETGSASEAVWLLPVSEAVSFCSPHSHLHRLVSKGALIFLPADETYPLIPYFYISNSIAVI